MKQLFKIYEQLFREIKHRHFSKVYSAYKKDIVKDTAAQVFMTLVATAVSAPLWLIPFVGWVLAPIAYTAVYTLLSKYFSDIRYRYYQAKERARSFYPVASERSAPTSLNERANMDITWKDSMAAGISGHPGGYYAYAHGQTSTQTYDAEVIVNPYSRGRSLGLGSLGFLFGGNLDSDLPFDNQNIDYLMLSSELPALDDKEFYEVDFLNSLTPQEQEYLSSLPESSSLFSHLSNYYEEYKYNTIGYLEHRIAKDTDGELNRIIPIMDSDGEPQYRFVDGNSPLYKESGLYRPVVVSEERYNELKEMGKTDIEINITARNEWAFWTEGITLYDLTPEENELYAAKIPLSDIAFEYPINSIYVDVYRSNNLYLQNIEISNAFYTLDSGNIYFTRPIEDILCEQSPEFMELHSNRRYYSKIFYKFKVNVALILAIFLSTFLEIF
ncbi:hypothetical protein ES708_21221 [subsurface metagenome]